MNKTAATTACVVLLFLAADVFAVSWDNGSGDNFWSNPVNWSGDILPTTASLVDIALVSGPIINAPTAAAGYLIRVGMSGGHENNTTVQDTIQPLCTTYGVQIVLGGHNHYYSRAVVSDVHHLTHGGGGAPLYTPVAGYPNIVTYTKSLAVSKVEISGNTLTCITLKPDGTVIDTFTLTKP